MIKIKYLKKIINVLFIILVISCKKFDTYYDFEGPKLNFYTYNNDKILFQFNEPVKCVEFNLINENNIRNKKLLNKFPVSNIYINKDFFYSSRCKLVIKALDTKENQSNFTINSPVYNKYPANLVLDTIRIKYSKKRKQMITVKTIDEGSINGYKLVLYIRGDKIEVPFSDLKVVKNQKFNLYINSVKDDAGEKRNIINKKNSDLFFRYRLSQISSLIYLISNEDVILDYFLYYNLKKHNNDYYMSNKYFKNYLNELSLYENDNPEINDVSKTTTIKIFRKSNEGFIVKK